MFLPRYRCDGLGMMRWTAKRNEVMTPHTPVSLNTIVDIVGVSGKTDAINTREVSSQSYMLSRFLYPRRIVFAMYILYTLKYACGVVC